MHPLSSQHLDLILIVLGLLIGGPLCLALTLGLVQVNLGERPWWTGWREVVRSVVCWPVVALLSIALWFAGSLLWPQGRVSRFQPPHNHGEEGVDPP